MNRYTISAYKHSSTLIKGLQNYSLNPNIEQMINAGSGAADPTFIGVGQSQPELTFDTTAIKTALAGCGGITGAPLSSDVFFFQKMEDGGTRAGALSHKKVTAALGMIIPVSIRAARAQRAIINYRVIMISADGTASPIVITDSQSLEVDQGVADEVYTMGAVNINGSELEQVDEWSIDFGIAPDINFGSGHVYPTAVGVMNRQPRITVTTFDVDAFDSWDIEGDAQGETDSTVELLDQLAGGVRGSSPITFAVDAGMVHFDSLGGNQGEKVGGQAIITPVWDGTADILAITGLS
jgi:hypothetical protein